MKMFHWYGLNTWGNYIISTITTNIYLSVGNRLKWSNGCAIIFTWIDIVVIFGMLVAFLGETGTDITVLEW